MVKKVSKVLRYKKSNIGFLIGELRNKFFVVRDIYVLPRFRGKGFGSTLLQEVVTEYRKPVVALGVLKGSERFYRSLGFKSLPSYLASYKRLKPGEKKIVREIRKEFPWIRRFKPLPEKIMFLCTRRRR